MLVINNSIVKMLPIIQFNLYKKEHNYLVQSNLIKPILLIFKNHFNYQYKVLTAISAVDYPDNTYRFCIVYDLLSIKFNSRVRVRILTDELTPIDSVESIFPGATWWECEIWDMFGVFFLGQTNITRLLSDYGFQGFPLRKDFPLSGFIESRYNVIKNRVVYENIELSQEYRLFDFVSPWEKLN
jgi:NADH:ubiquinone oxidoreductase subunit C